VRSNVPITSGNTIVGHPAPKSPLASAHRESPGPNLADQRMRRIYHEYVEARRKNNEGEVRYESLVNSIERMMPDLQKKHAGKQIDFEVVVKDGRVGLKPKAT
jgi:CRISPR/Cas system CSM-associated protein Csm2 small subunit